MVLLLTALIALASVDGWPPGGELALVLMAMLASQLAIGWSNDYLDRHADAVHQPAKPVPSGLVDARLMPPAIFSALTVSAVTGVLLGLVPLLLLTIGTACGFAYNFGFKGTRFSAAPFVLAFAVLPVFVWTAVDAYRGELLAIYGIGIALPVAVHVANVLPDLESDRAQGRRTAAVALGRERAVAVTMACQLAPLPLTALSLAWLEYEAAVLLPAALALAAVSAVAGLLYRRGRSRGDEVWAFRCVVLGAIAFVGGWLSAVQS
jgi:4-hydroxybenzoate polyprenyltransferase